MPTILLFHHVQGLTSGVIALADAIRAAGHIVHTPDLLDGQTFPTIADGMAHVQAIGFPAIIARGAAAAEAHPDADVFIGMSLGVLPAQYLAQTLTRTRAAALLHSAVPETEFGPRWPRHVPVQVHGMDADPEFVNSGDLDAAMNLVSDIDDGNLFLYPGRAHIFTDASLPDYDAEATETVLWRILAMLDELG